jgi:hypothetical protein
VPEHVADYLRVDALLQEQRRGAMAQVVEADVRQAGEGCAAGTKRICGEGLRTPCGQYTHRRSQARALHRPQKPVA